MRVGVLGGTFDPIHYGHLVVADTVCEQLELDLMLFVPCGVPPHRSGTRTTPAEHRYLMTVLATTGHPRFRVSRLELDRPGPSYTVDTLEELHRRFGPGLDISFVLGVDAFQQFGTWRNPGRILELARLVVVSRPGYDQTMPRAAISALPASMRARVLSLTAATPDISASELRERLQAGKSVRYLLPQPVNEYIEQHGLYTGAEPDGKH